ncbi:MAG: glycosyltransferase family 2 protein [Calditerrivibrio sp.]|nr:glycosyltransferase family 2 protein [Calditerrivibrio sp.]MCA1932132.1 glycosyltransferase family 2 protein [Calditerrivibrio sp.]MCA1980562.1 glycosyltransferase family 2 protein [Calditerrivibrio sp.]
MPDIKKISVVLPVYNEEGNIESLYREITKVIEQLGYDYEILFIDDCSKDTSLDIIKQIHKNDPHVKYISFEKNSGQSAALYVGFQNASGDTIITLDADLQNDPNDIPMMLEYYKEYDIVNGWRKNRQDTLSKKIASKIGNGIRNWFTKETIKDTGCALKIMNAEILKKVKGFKGFHRFIPTLMRLEGAKVVEVPVNHRNRFSGVSKYNNIKRGINGLYDLIGVRWTISRHIKPIIKEKKIEN